MSKRKDSVTIDEVQAIARGEMPDGDTQADGTASNGKPKETKAQRFRRLAETRVQRALDRIAKLVPLGNRGQYEWGPQEADAIVGALNSAVERVKHALTGGGDKKMNFRLL